MSNSKFLKDILIVFPKFFKPLERLTSPKSLEAFLAEFGWALSSTSNIDTILELFDFTENLSSIQDLVDSDTEDIDGLINLIKEIFDAIDNISTQGTSTTVFPFSENAFWETFPKELLDFLIINFIQENLTQLYGLFRLLGIITNTQINDDPLRFTFNKRKIRWDRMPRILSDFKGLVKDVYNWDSSGEFRSSLFIQNLSDLTCRTHLLPPSGDLLDALNYTPDSQNRKSVYSAVTNLINYVRISETGSNLISIDLIVLPIPSASSSDDYPIGFMVGLAGNADVDITIPISNNLKLVLSGNFIGDGSTIRLEVRPQPEGVSFRIDPQIGDIETEIKLIFGQDKPTVLIGSPSATHLEIASIEASTNMKKLSGSTPDFGAEIAIKGGKLVILGGDGDGFINEVLPKDPINIEFDFLAGYSQTKGFYIEGSAGFEYTFQINKSFGPIFINTVDLKLDLSAGKIVLITAVTGGVEVGPVSAIVHGIGLKTILELGKPGILGKADLSLGFKPPTMIGFGINTSTAKGWGMLEIDPPNYAGGFGLNIVDKFAVAAYVLIATELPNGEPGFSLFTSFIGEFMPGIQLGYGFVLYGFGGLFGLNRRMCEEALRVGIKNGEATKIFNTNPGIDTGNFLESIRSFFPVCDGHYVFGPMVKIFWGGAKKVIEFSGGIFVEFGGPIRIAILGNIHAALPKEESPVIVLNVDILGFIDLGKKTLAIDGSIFNSKLLKKYKLSGEFALRASWGTPSFAVSFGGFHPQARHIPPNFPKLKRMKISLGKKNPRISLSCYLALTSNTFQTGAKLDIHYKVSSFVVTADLGFDALIIFNPFSFEVDIDGRAKVKKGGSTLFSIDLGLDLTGPNPYCVKGYGVIKIWKIKTKVRFNKTFGEKVSESRPIVSPADLLREELQMAQPILELPAWASKGVVLTEDAEDYLSPLGRIVWTQTRVPLNTNLDLCGAGKPPNEQKKIKLEVYRVTPTGHTDFTDLLTDPPTEFFAPGQWKTYNSDAKRLSAPPFELWTSGVAYEGGGRVPDPDYWQLRENEYETSLVNPPEVSAEVEFVRMDQVPRFTIANLPSTRARLASKIWAMQAGKNYYKPARKRTDKSSAIFVQVKEPSFTVTTHEADGERFERVEVAGNPASDMTYHEALDLARENGENDVVIRNSAFAKSLQNGG